VTEQAETPPAPTEPRETGDVGAGPTTGPAGKRQRRIVFLLPVLAAAVGFGAWAWWSQIRVDPVQVSLALPNAPRLASAAPGQTVYRIDATRSSVTYEVEEILAGKSNVAKGTTRGIAGDILIDADTPSASKVGEIVVNVQQLTSDQEVRDNRLRHEYLSSMRYPLAYLRVSEITGMPTQIETGKDYPIELKGELQVKAITKPITLAAVASKTADDELKVAATATVKLAEWSIGPISLGPLVKSGDEAKLTFTTVAINEAKGLPYDVVEAAPLATLPAPSGGPSFNAMVKPILEKNCASCHNPGQAGSGIWTLETAADAAKVASGLGLVTGSGYMPPWPASDVGIPLKHARAMSDDDIRTISEWSAARGPLDVDPATKIVAAPDNLEAQYAIRADQRLTYDAPYQGSTDNTNDYRCFVLDPKFTEPSFVTGFQFLPDQLSVAHHALGFKVEESQKEAVAKLDADSEGTGWQCYAGMSGPGGTQSPDGTSKGSQLIMGWVPGQRPNKLPAGSGIKMGAGDVIVVQVHYHFAHEAPADRSAMVIETSTDQSLDEVLTQTYLGPAEIPCGPDEQGPMCDRNKVLERLDAEFGPTASVIANGLMLLCGKKLADYPVPTDGIAHSTCDQRVRRDGELISITGHEHEIGKTFRMTLNPGTPNEKILLDIPDWDFKWQLVYAPEETIQLKRGDVLRVECSWDRDLIKSVDPIYVTWAEGTEDEMCYSAVTTRLEKN